MPVRTRIVRALPPRGDAWMTEKLREYQHVLECVDPTARVRLDMLFELNLQMLETAIVAAGAERVPAHV